MSLTSLALHRRPPLAAACNLAATSHLPCLPRLAPLARRGSLIQQRLCVSSFKIECSVSGLSIVEQGSNMYLQFTLLALWASAAAALPVAPAVSADCKIFYTGQCPGDDSCLCTLNEPCSSAAPCIRNSSASNCGGACRKVAHNLCPGGTNCLADVGDCDAPPPPPSYAWGPDVSDYQGGVDWAAVKAAGASFAFTKATEGLTFTCETFAPNWQGMRDAGIGFRCETFTSGLPWWPFLSGLHMMFGSLIFSFQRRISLRPPR